MARVTFTDIFASLNQLMTERPDEGHTYHLSQGESQSLPPSTSHQRLAVPSTGHSISPHQPASSAIHPASIAPQTPTQTQGNLPEALLEVFSAQSSQLENPNLYSHTVSPTHPSTIPPNFTVSSAQQSQVPVTYQRLRQDQHQEESLMWPANQTRYVNPGSRGQLTTDRSGHSVSPSIPEFQHQSLAYEGGSQSRREPGHYSHVPSTDTRRGKERVLRACPKCGVKNHIRKKECGNCKEPKEPPKKRVKRPKRKKTILHQAGESSHHGLTTPPGHLDEIQPVFQQALPARSEMPPRDREQREEILQSMVEPRTTSNMPVQPSLLPASTEEQIQQQSIYHQRSSGFSSSQPFDGSYRNY